MSSLKVLEKIEKIVNAGSAIEKPLTMDEACQFMNMSKSTLYKLTHKKAISFSKPNGKIIYFKKCDLVEWMLKNPVRSHDQIEDVA